MASAAVADGTVFAASNDESQDADLVALDADTGDERWRIGVQAHVTGPVTWADGVLYLADDSGRIAAYDAGDGDSAGGADGRDVYQQHCASCHGGDGSGSSGPSLAGVADRLDLEQHVAIVRDGRGEMPGWKGTLSDAEIDAVVAYERDVLDDEAAKDG